MEWEKLLPRDGVARKTLWAIVILCHASILSAGPTITVYSTPQNGGLHLEGIILEVPGTLRRIEIDGIERVLTSDDWDAVRYPGRDGKGVATTIPWSASETGSLRLPQNLDYITYFTVPTTWTPTDRQLASSRLRPEMAPFHLEGAAWPTRRY